MSPIERDDAADLNDWRYFAAVHEAGGFSAAARALGLPKSRLSRRVAGLEARLGVRLLHRSTRRLVLTDIGRAVLAHAQALLREAGAAEALARAQQLEPAGVVRLSMPTEMLDTPVGDVVLACLHQLPKVSIETVLTSRRVDLLAEGLDIAIRVRAPDDEDPQWSTLRLGPTQALLVASPALVAERGAPDHPSALAGWPALGPVGTDRRIHWRLVGPSGQTVDASAAARLSCEQFRMRLRAAESGLGVTLVPHEFAKASIDAGRLAVVLPGWAPPASTLQAVYVTQRGLSPAVRAVLDALRDALRPAA